MQEPHFCSLTNLVRETLKNLLSTGFRVFLQLFGILNRLQYIVVGNKSLVVQQIDTVARAT